ncbi:MAG: arginine N-succinyltransferase [Legionellales bacterium]
MMLFRNACASDLDEIVTLAKQSGVGLTSLPHNKELLKKRLDLSSYSFQKEVQEPAEEYYLFVLEDSSSKEIVGTSALEAKTGYETPFYSYHISKYSRLSHSLHIRSEYELLTLVNDNEGRSEFCTLFLEPKYRKKNNGLLLTKGCFLFMAQHPKRFTSTVIAELRGINTKEQSPFWEHVGRHFFQMPFKEADRLNLATNKQFIEDLMPQYPLYVPLLDPQAQKAIGKPHASTIPAMNILVKEGFRFNNYVHIFDAGPTYEAAFFDIKTIALSRLVKVSSISDEVRSVDYLIGNMHINFRATISSALIHDEDDSCILSRETAETLEVHCGNFVRITPLNPAHCSHTHQGI